MANRFNRSIREIKDIDRQPLHTNEQNDLLSDVNDDVYVRLRRRYERITGLPELEKKFQMHLLDYNQFKDDTQQMLIFLNDENERQDKMIDKLNTDVDDLNKKAKKLKQITDEQAEQLKTLTTDINDLKDDVKNNRQELIEKVDALSKIVDEIKQQDDKNKLQSEVDELKNTVENIQNDLEEEQTLEDMRELQRALTEFFSISSNVTENVAGVKDHVYFDIYSIGQDVDPSLISVSEQEMSANGELGDTHYLAQTDDYTIDKVNGSYTSIGVDTSKYEHIHIFTLTINNIPYHTLQVKFSNY